MDNAALNERRDARFDDVVGDESLEALAGGFGFLEGPVWHPARRDLVFSDIPGSTIHSWSNGQAAVYREPSNHANGSAYDRSGRLVTCEHGTSRVVRENDDGAIEVLAESFGGKGLNSPNDVVVSSWGGVYFTDPPFGRTVEGFGVVRELELDFCGVYGLQPGDDEPALVSADLDLPNGLCFSLDETALYVNDTAKDHIRRFVRDGDRFDDAGVWATTVGEGDGHPDGMKLDQAGNLYCTGPGGIHVFDPDAICLGVLGVPEPVANFAFGDDDMRTLYICASTTLYRCRVRVPGPAAF